MKEDLEDLIGIHVTIVTKEAQIRGMLIDCGVECVRVKTYFYHIDSNSGVRKITYMEATNLPFDVVIPYREILDVAICVVEGPA